MAKRIRMWPPAHLSRKINSKLVVATMDIQRLTAQGWTMTDPNEEPQMNTDPPPQVQQAMEVKRKRPRIKQA